MFDLSTFMCYITFISVYVTRVILSVKYKQMFFVTFNYTYKLIVRILNNITLKPY